jgi:uncharacterized membrane protein YdjX (TVP38/TMEM64 family)
MGVLRRALRGNRSHERNRLSPERGRRRVRRTLRVPGVTVAPAPSPGAGARGAATDAGKRKLAVAIAVLVVVLASGTLLSQRIPDSVSAPLFILVVVLEVVVAPIPGGAIGYLGAARFGFWEAWPLLYLGNIIGTTLVFFLARRFGAPLFEAHVPPRVRQRYDQKLQERPFLLWLAYAVPLLPVDVLSILAGLSHMPARRFFLTAFTGYISYTAIVAYVGDSLSHFIGVTNAISVLGGIFFIGLLWWVWRGSRNVARASREKRAAAKT